MQNRITLANLQTITYDYLIGTTGPKLAFEKFGAGADRLPILSVPLMPKAPECYRKFLEKSGYLVVIRGCQSASCFGPAYRLPMIVGCRSP